MGGLKTINVKEILDKHKYLVMVQTDSSNMEDPLPGAIREIVQEALALAADNAQMNKDPADIFTDAWFKQITRVNKESITNTINQVKFEQHGQRQNAFCDKANESYNNDYWSDTLCGLEYTESPLNDKIQFVTCKKCIKKYNKHVKDIGQRLFKLNTHATKV